MFNFISVLNCLTKVFNQAYIFVCICLKFEFKLKNDLSELKVNLN